MSVPKRILVIGGGPTGLVALRNLNERGRFEHVELYERRDNIGGVWYFDQEETMSQNSSSPRWPSPAYSGLIGNVLPDFLSFSGFPFPEPPSTPNQPFPSLTETYNYLRQFAEPYLNSGVIKLKREVIRAVELEDGKGWSVVYRDWSLNDEAAGKTIEESWDAIVVAVGWYDHPVWPDTDGLDDLKKRGLAEHAKWWRDPQKFLGKKTLVVGNANSSNEIAAQLAPIAQSPVYQSIRRTAFPGFPSLPDDRIRMVAPVSRYILSATASDGSEKFDALLADGTLLHNLDTVQIGTGYRPFPDFVHVLCSQHCGASLTAKHVPLVSEFTHPARVPSLHRLIMYAHNPTLGFIGAPMAYTPFTVADVASTWLALAWRGEIAYPSTPEGRLIFEKERLEAIEKWRGEMENPTSFLVYNVLGAGEQEYARSLKADIVQARPELVDVLAEWSDAKTKLREAMHRTKFEALKYARDHAEQLAA